MGAVIGGGAPNTNNIRPVRFFDVWPSSSGDS